jgi:hypothetical protein
LRWLHTKKLPLYDEAGLPRYMLGISEDITDRKQHEEIEQGLRLKQLADTARPSCMSWRKILPFIAVTRLQAFPVYCRDMP